MTDPAPAPEAPARAPLAIPTALERALGNLVAPRMGLWLWLSVALLGLVWWLAQHMLAVILYKVVIITIAAFVGDKISRAAEKSNKRPHELLAASDEERAKGQAERAWQLEQLAHGCYYRRALVIGACVIAGALGS